MIGNFKAFLIAAACLVLLNTGSGSISAQIPSSQNTNTISGFVFSETRAPIPRIYVELQSDFYATVARVQTRNSGMFTFSGLAPGHYYLKVVTTGTDYEEQTRSVTLAAISGRLANTEQVDFYLGTRKNRNARASAAPGVVFLQEVPAEAQDLYNSALEDLTAKNEKAAFEKLKRSIEIFPEYFAALDRLGNEYIVRGHYEAAYVLLTKALTVNQRSHNSTLGLGLALFRLKQTDLAIGHFKSATVLEPTSPNGHLWLGIALHSKKKNNDALQSLIKANELSNGTIAEVHWQLARVYKDQNEFDKSADELELFLKLNPEAKNAPEVRQIIEFLRKKT